MRASARADDCRSERSGTVGSTSESQKAWSSCRSSCSVHGSVLPLLRRSHVERYWLIATEISSSPRQQQARCGAEGADVPARRWRRRLGCYQPVPLDMRPEQEGQRRAVDRARGPAAAPCLLALAGRPYRSVQIGGHRLRPRRACHRASAQPAALAPPSPRR